MSKSNARKTLIVLVLFAITIAASCAARYITVSEAWERAESLDRKEVRVRGHPVFAISQTMLACVPWTCDCNRTEGSLFLVEEGLDPRYDNASISISGSSLDCQGDECSMYCTPFDPSGAEEFEFVGTLRARGSGPDSLILEDLDLEASRRLFDGEWIPIETGRFTLELREE